jgi:hypothetical protein
MDFAPRPVKDDFYEGASFLSKAGKEYRFKCVKAESEILILFPAQPLQLLQKLKQKANLMTPFTSQELPGFIVCNRGHCHHCLDENNSHGITISSFNTVSLEPPLILWSLKKAFTPHALG